MPAMEIDNKTYEISYLLSPLIPEDKVAEEVNVLRKAIEEKGGFIVSEEQAKMQKLAYKIKKLESAYFGWFKFSIKPDLVSSVKFSFDKNDKMIRSMIVEAGKENPPQFTGRRPSFAKKNEAGTPEEPKAEVKPEQVDEKLEEILKKSA